jgi:hypothetical protein
MAVLAGALDDGKGFRIDLRLAKDGLVGAGSSGRPEGMNQGPTYGGHGSRPYYDEKLFEHSVLLDLFARQLF